MNIIYVNDYEQDYYQTEEHQQNDDVIVMFDYKRVNNEFLITDYKRLMIFWFISCLRRY